VQKRFGFIYADYKKSKPFADLMEMFRKLLTTGAIMFLFPGTMLQVGAALLITYWFWVLHTRRQPFKDSSLNIVQELNLGGLTFTMFCALMLKSLYCDSENEITPEVIIFQWVLFIGNGFVVGGMLTLAVYDGLISNNDSLGSKCGRWYAQCCKVLFGREIPEERVRPNGVLSGVMDLSKVMEAMDATEAMKRALGSVQDERDVSRESEEVISALVTCFEISLYPALHLMDEECTDIVELQADKPSDMEWPPKSQLGLQLYVSAIDDVVRSFAMTDPTSLVKPFQEAFMVVKDRDCELSDDIMAWYTTVNSEVRIAGVMETLQGCFADGADRMREQLYEVCHEATADIGKQVHDELPVAIEHTLRAHTTTGKIANNTELHTVIDHIQEQFSEYLPTLDNKKELIASAELWLCVDSEISFDDFSTWFLDVFGRKPEPRDCVILPSEESSTVRDLLQARRMVEENKAANADIVSVRDTARFKARMKMKSRGHANSVAEGAGSVQEDQEPPVAAPVPVGVPVDDQRAMDTDAVSPVSRPRLRPQNRSRARKAGRGTVQI